MPFFEGAVGVNASHGVFNDITGDQYNYPQNFHGPVHHGDTYHGPIYGSNVGGRGNFNTINHWATPAASATPATSSSGHYTNQEAQLAARLREVQAKIDAARQKERAKREAARAQESINRLEAEVAAKLAELALLSDNTNAG